MKKKYINIISVLLIISILFGIIGMSYAYFSLEIEGTCKDNVVVAGDLRIRYTDNSSVSLVNAFHGDSVTKEMTIENIGTINAVYTMKLNDFNNQIENDELKLDYTCEEYDSSNNLIGSCGSETDVSLPLFSGNFVIKSDISIEPTYIHKYKMTFTFIDTLGNQDYNKKKNFAATFEAKTFQKAVDTNADTDNIVMTSSIIIGDPVDVNVKLVGSSSSSIDSVTYVIYRKRRSETKYSILDSVVSTNKANNFSITYEDGNDIDFRYDYTGSMPYSYNILAYNTNNGKLIKETIVTENFCFVAGTKVLTQNGYKNIEDIKIGEMVYSYNLNNNELELKEVINTILSYTKDTYKVTIDGKIVEMSPKHQVYIIDKGWVRAYDLKVGDKMLKSDNTIIEIENIEYKVYDKVIPTYNLTVEDNNNFYVSEIQVLVHFLLLFDNITIDL